MKAQTCFFHTCIIFLSNVPLTQVIVGQFLDFKFPKKHRNIGSQSTTIPSTVFQSHVASHLSKHLLDFSTHWSSGVLHHERRASLRVSSPNEETMMVILWQDLTNSFYFWKDKNPYFSLCTVPPLVHILFSTKLDIRLLALSKYGFLMKSFHGLLAIFFPIFSPSNSHLAQSVTAQQKSYMSFLQKKKKRKDISDKLTLFRVLCFPGEMTKATLRLCEAFPPHHNKQDSSSQDE